MGKRYLNSIFNDSDGAEEKFSTGKLMDHLCRIISTVISIVFFASPNQSVANDIMGGMACEIINLKTLNHCIK